MAYNNPLLARQPEDAFHPEHANDPQIQAMRLSAQRLRLKKQHKTLFINNLQKHTLPCEGVTTVEFELIRSTVRNGVFVTTDTF